MIKEKELRKTKEELEEMRKEWLKEIRREELTPLNWEITNANKLLKMELPKSEFLVKNLIPLRAITILAGNPSSYKSWVLLEIVKVISSNRKLFDEFETKKDIRVLYLDEESSRTETQRRFKLLTPPYLCSADFMNLQGFRIDDPEKRKALLDLAAWRGYGLIIFDSLRDLHSKNENDSREAQELIDYFKEFTKKGITILISHHNRKEGFLSPKEPSQILRGSSAILAGVDSLLSIENTKSTNQKAELIISQPKLRQGKANSPFKVNLIEEKGMMRWEYKDEVEEESKKIETAKESILKFLEEGKKCRKEIIETLIPLYFRERTIDRAIRELKEDQAVKPRKEGTRTYLTLNK